MADQSKHHPIVAGTALAFVQPPIRNGSILGVSVYGHSGEFGPTATDLRLPGRMLDLELIRSYRSSLANRIGELGRGWSLNLFKRVERMGDKLIYHDGAGCTYPFVREAKNRYTSPAGFYGVVAEAKGGVAIHHRYGIVSRFEPVERGGRLCSVEDRNGNMIALEHLANRIVVLDSLGRRLIVTLAKGRIQNICDHAGRIWEYRYDDDDNLIEVQRPATAAFPRGTTLRYGYDAAHRLTSLTDAKGQTWLTVHYDDSGRVLEQRHGRGNHEFTYEAIRRQRSMSIRTTCRLRNGGKLVVEHNAAGNPIKRTLLVRRSAFAPEDIVGVTDDIIPLITTCAYNHDSELVTLTEPAGNSITWKYAENEDDPRNRGNCLRRIEKPAMGAPADQPTLVTIWTRDRTFQAPLSIIDPRGHKTTHRYDERGNRIATAFAPVSVQPIGDDGTKPKPATLALEVAYAFNSRGQLLRKTHIDGTVTAYEYYPVADPIGAAGPGTATSDSKALCGYLARVTRDATGSRRRNEFRWDEFGNLVAVLDHKQNAARQHYDSLGRLLSVVGREPFADTIEYRHDHNGNEIESIQPFERLELDETSGEPVARKGTIREMREYDALDSLIARTIAGGRSRISERFIRDKGGRVVRVIHPSGTVTELQYDERDLVVSVTRAAGTKQAVNERRTYTRNGNLRSVTDAKGGRIMCHYDGYERWCGVTDRVGTTSNCRLDEAGNVVRITVESSATSPKKRARVAPRRRTGPLLEAGFQYDEWSRVVRIDQAWRHPNGKPLGPSGWDGREGTVSTLIEYGTHGRAVRVWSEGDNVFRISYDGLGQVVAVNDSTGDSASFAYDENGNATEARLRGPNEAEVAVDRLRYDGMDRLVARQVGDATPERFHYESLGGVSAHVRGSGMVVRLLHDPLGRRVGQVLSIDGEEAGAPHRIVRRLEFDDAYRLIAHTGGAGDRSTYRYDALDRQIGVVYPDGTEAIAEYDANGNVVRTLDPAGNETLNRYDAGDRLIERRTQRTGSDAVQVEAFEYDAIGRLVRARANKREIRRTYDSLSRLLIEEQAGRIVRATYDPAGNQIELDYPGGESIRRTFDVRGRVTEVIAATGEQIASVRYHAGEKVGTLTLGGKIEATCRYDSQERLQSVTYRRLADGALVEGYRYARDDAGRIIHEVQESDGVGQRFWFDGFNRPVRARYRIKDVLDPASPFESETSYDWFPDGPWRHRRDTDGKGAIISDQVGTLDQRNRYRRFGGTSFAYDAVGNITRKGTDNPGFCLYTYDGQHRLVKVECFSANAQRTKTIEYEYDGLGRLVRKVVTDAAGVVIETTYVWAGTTLLEEYENGVLVRTYVYTIGSQPARLTVNKNGRTDYLYVHDGRGLATGLVRATDPNAFAERYGYEITGRTYLKEVDGVSVDLPARSTTPSSLWNSVLSGDPLGSLMFDWSTWTFAGRNGRHFDATIAGLLNTDASLTGGVHTTLGTTLDAQFHSFLGVLGLGSRNGFVSHGGAGGQGSSKGIGTAVSSSGSRNSVGSGLSGSSGAMGFLGRDFSLYAAGSDTPTNVNLFPSSGQNPAFDFSGGGGGSSGTSGVRNDPPIGGIIGEALAAKDRIVNWTETTTSGAVAKAVVTTIVTSLVKSIVSEKGKGPQTDSPPSGSASSSGSGQVNDAQKNQNTEQDKAKKEQQDNEKKEKEKQENLEKENANKKKEEEEKKKDAKYFDPDQQAYTSMAVSSPEQIEMRLNGRKRPVNPNTDGGQPQLDTSSPPPHHGGVDPTIARFDGEVYGSVSLDRGEMKVSIAPIDYHRDKEPPTPITGSSGSAGSGDVDHDIGWNGPASF